MKKNKLLLAIPIFLSLIGCSNTLTTKEEKTTENTTTEKQTTSSSTTRERTTRRTTISNTTGERTTRERTTRAQTTTKENSGSNRNGRANVINFYCWNDEFQSRVNMYYGGKEGNFGRKVEATTGSTTILKNGVTIQWTTASNEGSVYQDTLDIALDNNMVDMFCFEADYATKYVNSDYVIDLGSIGVDQSNQFKYTKDIATNAYGEIVGSSWQATPGVIIYNMNVAKAVWGNDITEEEVDAKLSTSFDTFKTAAGEVAAKNASIADAKDKLYTLIGPQCWYRTYGNNLYAKMYGISAGKKTITIDKNLFKWAKDTQEFNAAGYIKGVSKDYGLWQGVWGNEMGKDNCLCVFGCPWFVDFSFKGYYKVGHTADFDKDGKYIGEGTEADYDSNWRVCKGYSSWFWGGTWITATPVSQQEETIKNTIKDIIVNMTCTQSTLLEISKETKDFTNDQGAMEVWSEDDNAKDPFFGSRNVYAVYVAAIAGADMSKSSDFDQQITEEFQAAFTNYFQGTKTAEAAWADFKTSVEYKTSVSEIKMADGVTVSGNNITIS